MPPTPSPQNALAAIRLDQVGANALDTVPTVKRLEASTYGIFRPKGSDIGAYNGWTAIDVIRKALTGHVARLLLLNVEAMAT